MNKLKKQNLTIGKGDFNANLGAGKTSVSVGPFGPGERNSRGDRLEIFVETNTMTEMNTWFILYPRKINTWKSLMNKPGNIVKNQVDFILVSQRFKNSCIAVRTYRRADSIRSRSISEHFQNQNEKDNPKKWKNFINYENLKILM